VESVKSAVKTMAAFRLKDQATRLSTAGKNLHAWVLDCSLLKPAELSTTKKRTKSAKPGKSASRRRTQRKPPED
jgi:hypothetical protein